MKVCHTAAILCILIATKSFAADQMPTLEFHFAGKPPADDAKPAILKLGLDLLRSANFNTVTHADLLKQSVPEIQDSYRRALAGDYILIRYEEPVTF